MFICDERGTVAIIFAFILVSLAGLVGAAVDFARQSHAHGLYREAIDGAVLAGARHKQGGASDDQAIAVANAFMVNVKQRMPLTSDVRFRVTNDGSTLVGDVRGQLRSTFLRVIGIPALPVNIDAEAKFGEGPDMEMSLMLDVTGSMFGSKIADLKAAVEDLIDIVVTDHSKSGRRRIAMAPFSNAVRLNNKQFEAATGKPKKSYSGCVVERAGSSAMTDDAPGPGSYVVPLEDVSAAPCRSAKDVFPLTNKKADLKKMVRELSASGMTAGHIGTAWAWYTLSPQWSGAFEADEEPEPYQALKEKKPNGSARLRKVAVLMTDGEYNMSYNGAAPNAQAEQLCAGMKEKGIEVFTVGFDVGENATVINTLKHCASTASHFYNVTDGVALRAAFRDIALKASDLRLSR